MEGLQGLLDSAQGLHDHQQPSLPLVCPTIVGPCANTAWPQSFDPIDSIGWLLLITVAEGMYNATSSPCDWILQHFQGDLSSTLFTRVLDSL